MKSRSLINPVAVMQVMRSSAVSAVIAGSLLWLLLSALAQAQEFVDESADSLDRNDRALLLSVLKKRLPDPQSARLRGLGQPKPGVYCGEVSTRSRGGEYREFTRFVVETKIRQATIAPTADPTRIAMILRMIEDRCRSEDAVLR